MIVLAVKIVTIVVISGCLAFMIRYHKRTRGAAWRDPIGKSIMIPVIFMAGEALPFFLAAFFRLSVLGSKIGSWAFIACLGLGGLAMWWRTWVWGRHDPEAKQ